MSSRTILSVEDLHVMYLVREGILHVVHGISLNIDEGVLLGLVGESGSGKSSLAEAIIGVMPPNARVKGKILFRGKNIFNMGHEERRRIRWEKISMVFQGAQRSLNPVLKVKDHFIDTYLSHRKATHEEIIEKASRLLKLVGLESERVLESYPHELSGGMKQRVIIALSLLLDPELVILDEPISALDAITGAQVLRTIKEIHDRLRIAMILITHDIASLAGVVEKVAVMYAGEIVEIGNVDDIFLDPLHPYTAGLISSIPSLLDKEVKPIPGNPPSLLNRPSGCPFHPRCPFATEICKRVEPELKKIGKDRYIFCHLYS